MFPEEMFILQQEIQRHPNLTIWLASLPNEATLEERIGVVFAYCGMVVDGYYNEQELAKLIEIAIEKLRAASTITIH